jgi:HEAT repeat protein
MNELSKIVALLADEAIEKRIAAAIVLAEIRAKGPEVVDALAKLLESPVPALQRHGLDAIGRAGGAKKLAQKIFPLLLAHDRDVRQSAARALHAIGEDAVPLIRKRMEGADAEEKRALDAVLADLGGKDAFSTLLESMATSEGEDAKAAAIAVRQHVKGAGARERRQYLAETEKFLKNQKKGLSNQGAIAAAIKILGYLEDEKALPTLLEYASNAKEASTIRCEALIAMRFALGEKRGDTNKVTNALIDAAADTDRALAQTALHTLGSLELSADHARRLEKLVAHPDVERARFVIEQLGRQKGADAARVLVKLLASADKRRAELAAAALGASEDAVPLLGKALLETEDVDRAWMIKNVLRPSAKKIAPATRKQLLEAAVDRLEQGARGWEAPFEVAREADPESAATAVRALAVKLRKKDSRDKALTLYALLCRSDRATDEDRYARAALELAKSGRDTRPAARAGDEALKMIGALVGRGFDVAKALRTDKSLGLEELYYVGFHFAEDGHPLGEELLAEVVKKGGRQKIGRMAKNKLELVEAG